MDLNSYYPEIVRIMFPNAEIILDRFHMVQMLTKSFNSMRIQVMKKFDKKSLEYKILNQTFDKKVLYRVLHTDVTEYKLTSGKKVYISPVVDEASLEILACAVSYSPEMITIYDMLDELESNLPTNACPILHSDQDCQYQNAGCQA